MSAGSVASRANSACISGVWLAWRMAAFSLATTGAGVPAGAYMPHHTSTE